MTHLVPVSEHPPVADHGSRALAPERPHLRQLVGMVLRRGWLALGVGAVVFLLVLAAFSQATPTYVATGSLLIEPRRPNLAQTDPTEGGLPRDTSAIDTEVEVLKSHALAEAVVRRLKLYNDPEFNPNAERRVQLTSQAGAPEAEPDPRLVASVASRVRGRTQVRRSGLTYVVNVGFVSTSPEKAARLANGVMETYLDRQLENKVAAVVRANEELGARVESLRQAAYQAEAELQQYKNEHNLFSAQGATMAEQEVSTLNQQIAQAKADTAEKQARLAAALAQVRRGGGGADVGAALGSSTVSNLRQQEAELSIKLAQLKADFQPGYPEVRRTQSQLEDVRAQIQQEIDRIISNLRAEAQAAAQREASLLASRGQAQGGLVANNQAQVGLVALQQRADAAKAIYEGYLNRANEVAVEGSLQQPDASIASLAPIPGAPFSPNMRLALAFATLLSLLAAAASVLLLEFWEKRLRNGADVERELGVPFAGVLPDFASVVRGRRRRNPAAPADYIVDHPLSGFAEAFRNLRAFLLLTGPSKESQVIALTSAVPREGKSMASLCLARTMALSGSKVVLVDCDLRRRGISKLMDASGTGLVEVVHEGVPLERAMVRDPKSGAYILPAIEQGGIPYELFSRPEIDQLLSELRQHFDYVILDAPPVLGVADARIVAAKADSVIYVAQWNKTPVRAMQSAIDILFDCGANVSGAVLSRVNVKQQARYGYGDSSDYFHYYRDYYLTSAA